MRSHEESEIDPEVLIIHRRRLEEMRSGKVTSISLNNCSMSSTR
jgi:hypothetical protein